ncbi:MAG TPA: ABC-F family ATP-binding cassette domain-containing protein [Candidatus Omnitrophota bacterium]|nr:ABC-F family ATP-binding cassette domain-containing protein [Candidatus Omnitrophota bacterium]HRZ15530.1 ABC-F family ATP-binding cassette domain-containing protein [Candidatus Omnitrophota bacterium]
MITLTNISKGFGKRTLFQDLNLTINPGEKIGLIGPNGAGKSTFFSLLLGDTEPTSGAVQINKNVRIGYLPQESKFSSEHTVLGELIEGDKTIKALLAEKAQLEESNEAGSQRYGDILHELDVLGYFELEHKAEKILMGLGFKERDFNRPIDQMSGGWQMRTLLAKLLTVPYDILLLDEPTNYLDLNAALWLKDFLADFEGTFIMISHDKDFLTDVTNYTLILEAGQIFKVSGNYEHYEQIKAERRLALEKQYKEQEKKREQLERFVSRFHAQPNKAASVRAKRTVLERIEKNPIELPPDPRESIGNFSFPPTKDSGHRVMNLAHIYKSYGDIKVYEDFDFEVSKGEKAVLAGENGAGKSTLLKIMAGVIPQDTGERKVGHNVDIGYFSQTRLDVLNPENTVLREAYTAAPGYMAESVVRSILGVFLFTGDDADKYVKVLSGGEKSRLILAKLLINPPNCLLLDEPTTHLDVDAVDALITALNEYRGTIVFISHDIHFVRSLANVVYEVKQGTVRKFPGNFDYYLEKRSQGSAEVPAHRKQKHEHKKVDEDKQKARELERLRKEEERNRKTRNASVREKINKLEKEKEKLQLENYAKCRALADPKIFRDEETVKEYGRRLKEIEKEIADIDLQIKAVEKEII